MHIHQKSDQEIFRTSSITYYYSSQFFPAKIRNDVYALYAFVRTADNFVDCIPPHRKAFTRYYTQTLRAFKGLKSNDHHIKALMQLMDRTAIKQQWIISFLNAMKADLHTTHYHTYKQLQEYMYGSAEVIGLCLCRIFDVSPQAYRSARAQGEAMQLINFIRDIDEDLKLGRHYIPQEDCDRFNVHIPPRPDEKDRFNELVRFEIDRYKKIQQRAQEGYVFLPRRIRFVVQTAADMYMWTADKIAKNPHIIFRYKVKPSRIIVLSRVFTNAIRVCFQQSSKN